MIKKSVNDLIKINPDFIPESFHKIIVKRQTFQKKPVYSTHVDGLISQLNNILLDSSAKYFDKYLVTIKYKSVVPKSRRIRQIFKCSINQHDLIVGSSFYNNSNNEINHQITYYVNRNLIENEISNLEVVKNIINENYGGKFENANFESQYISKKMHKTCFYDYIKDISNIDSFVIYKNDLKVKENLLLTLFSIFDGKDSLIKFLNSIGISNNIHCFSDNMVLIRDQNDAKILLKKYNSLICQGITNINEFDYDYCSKYEKEIELNKNLGYPAQEPIIGVFDTYFDKRSYFSEWVECVSSYPSNIGLTDEDKSHATQVCNILVDGPRNNKWLEDNCGNFRVKLYEVAINGSVNTEFIYEQLETIVKNNPNIKVWNMSLGSRLSINNNQISLIASKIDEVSLKYNVIFVISGTNLNDKFPGEIKIGSPADSLNSLVVNSVKKDGSSSSYTRVGPVLTLFTKPDVSYYGGDKYEQLNAYSPVRSTCYGTSFAAPWISRKLAYLIYYLKLDPLIAKSMIIDSAARWFSHKKNIENNKIGYGVVPIDVKEIIKSDSDEIKFVISDVTQQYITKILTIPVPFCHEKNRFLYIAKVTMCYFVRGNPKHGVDYSNIEMNVKFGVNKKTINANNVEKIVIKSINQDKQLEDDEYVDERTACVKFQKWNNTKHLIQEYKSRLVGTKKQYGENWGLSITQIDRFSNNKTVNKYNVRFGLIVTLKQIKGDDAEYLNFIDKCSLLGLKPIVINAENVTRIYQEENADINWDDE